MTAKWNEIMVEIPGIYGSMQEPLRYRTEDGERVYQRKVVKNLYFYFRSLEGTIEYLRREAEGLVDVNVDSGYEYGGGDPDIVVLSGWTSDVPEKVIKAAEKEISEAPVREAAEKAKKKERAKKELGRLLKAHPDLAVEG